MKFSVMTSKPLETVATHSKAKQTDAGRDQNPHRDQAVNRKTQWIRVTFHADSNSVKNRHVKNDVYMAMPNSTC